MYFRLTIGVKLMKKILVMLLAFFCPLLAAEESTRLVVSAGALAGFDPYEPFYNSRIFIGENNPPFHIADGNVKAFESQQALFYSADEINPKDILSAKETKDSGSHNGLSGSSYQAFVLNGVVPEEVIRYLGAESTRHTYETRSSNGKLIFAFKKGDTAQAIVWPKGADDLKRVPAVTISDEKSSFLCVVKARRVADISHRLGLIDELLAKHTAGFIDLGTNHGDQKAISAETIKALAHRKLLAVFAGTTEMASLVQAPESINLPLIYPTESMYRRTVLIGNHKINLWSAKGNEKLWPLYSKLGKTINTETMINEMKRESADPKPVLNIVRVFSEEAAKEAAKSVYVDVVLLLAQDPFLQLPSREVIELKKAKTDAYEQIAPIVKISYLDVSEVLLFGPDANTVQRVEIHRHPISDDRPAAKDVTGLSYISDVPGLPALDGRAWRKDDLEKVLGGIMLQQRGADIAMFEAKPQLTPISGGISFELAQSLVSPDGNLIILTITGKQIKKINKLIAQNVLGKQISVYGMDVKTQSIGKRTLADNERFNVAVSESVLLDLFGISMMGGLGEEYAIRAPFVEAIYGKITEVWFIGGPKVIPIADTAEHIAQAVGTLHAGRSFDDLILSWFVGNNMAALTSFIEQAKGKPHHVLTFDVSYFDIGISKNITNNAYDAYSSGKALPMGRGGVPSFTHIFVFVKTALNYDTPSLITTLSGEVKYLHTNMEDKPEKDKTKLGLKLRLPWERSVFSDSSVVVSPLYKGVYETKLTPSFWVDNKKIPPRASRVDSLLGVNVDFTKLGFNLDVGGVMVNDFNRTNFHDATDFGPGMNFYSKWSLFGPVELSSEITSYYLFPLPKNAIAKKLALGVEGTVWLRLARYYDFSIAAVSDFLVATLQDEPKNFAVSSIFGLTVSYGRLFRLFG
jgi:hypothetical protein